nr:hypothetical protein [Nonomuraea ceibae]
MIGAVQSSRIRLDWLAGAWEGLRERADRMAQTDANLLPVTSELQLVLDWLARTRGDWDRAESCCQATRMSQPNSAIIAVANAAGAGMVTMLLNRGDVGAVCAYADRGIALLPRMGLWVWAGGLAPQAVEAYLAAGRAGEARRLVEDMRAGLAAHTPGPGHLVVCRARLAVAIRRYECLGLPYQTVRLTEEAAPLSPGDTGVLAELACAYEKAMVTRSRHADGMSPSCWPAAAPTARSRRRCSCRVGPSRSTSLRSFASSR